MYIHFFELADLLKLNSELFRNNLIDNENASGEHVQYVRRIFTPFILTNY